MDLRANTLEHVQTLLQEGKKREAQLLLVTYLKRYPTSAEAWWLMSQAVEDEKQIRDCLERVLRLQPGHEQARRRLEELKRPTPPTASVKPFLVPLDDEIIEQAAREADFLLTQQSDRAAREIPHPWSPPPEKKSTSETPEATASVSQLDRKEAQGAEESLAPPWAEPLSPPSAATPPPHKRNSALGWVSLLVTLCLLLAGGGAFFIQQNQRADQARLAATQTMIAYLASLPRPTLPPTWTPSPPPSPTPSPTPTETPSPTPTLPGTPFPTPIPTTAIGLVLGKYPPDFTLREVSTGAKIRLWDYLGQQPLLLVFWATWCPHCQNEMNDLIDIYTTYQAQGLEILAIETGQPVEEVRAFKKNYGLNFPVLSDAEQIVTSEYKISAVPTHFFIGRNGKIVLVVRGRMSKAPLEGQIKNMLRFFPTATPMTNTPVP